MTNRPDALGAGRGVVRTNDGGVAAATSTRERGNALYLQGRFTEAAACYREALRFRPDDPDTLNNLGAALADLGRLDEAIACYREALRLRPQYADALYNLGNALRLLGRFEEAVACYGQALRLRPHSAAAHNNLGTALLRLGRLEESITSVREALRLQPGYNLALINLGLALAESGRLAEAIACDDEVLRVEPGNADAHRNRALALLLAGDLARGWPDYLWRWKCADFNPPRFPQPAWDGAPLAGRTILLYSEQGLGDTLQFVRYARLVRRRGGVVVLAAQEALHPLLVGCEGIDRLVARDAVSPDFDVHYPLMSLPALLGTTLETIPVEVPYLRAEAGRVERWRRELGRIEGYRVGIAWQGSPTNINDRRRSIPLAQFAPLAQVEGVRLVSLQRGKGTEQIRGLDGRFPVVELEARSHDPGEAFLETAAIMANLDLVVTCDTSVAHLAGALGIPTWVALSFVPDWRWLLDREDSPWYPTLRLFRQVHRGSWEEPFGRMAEMLRARLSVRPEAGSITVAITPGELLDKITILEIKGERITDPERLGNVRSELAELVAARDQAAWHRAEIAGLVARLRAVNEAIWQAEDEVRRCEGLGDFGPRFVERARSIYRNNDERSFLKRRINEWFGGARHEEKIYPPYSVRDETMGEGQRTGGKWQSVDC